MTSLISRYAPSLLLLILAFAFFTRMYNIHEPNGYIFDEVYHAVTAKLIAHNDPRAFEWWHPAPEPNTAIDWLHPPTAKYFQAVSMLLFGENPFGWRFSSVIFGVGVVWITFLVAQAAFRNERSALFAALLASFDGLLLVQSRIAMNDIHVTFFVLLSCYWYFRHWQLSQENREYRFFSKRLMLSIAAAGIAMATKWSGVFVLGAIGIGEVARFVQSGMLQPKSKALQPRSIFQAALVLSLMLLIPLSLYLASYGQMFLQGKGYEHLKELHNQIWRYQTTLEATHPYQSRPWQWFLNLRPVWYAVDYQEGSIANIYAFGNTVLYLGGGIAIVTSLVWGTKQVFNRWRKKKPANDTALIVLLVCIWYAIVWMPWFLSPRIMFFYHYTPAVPLLAILTSYWLQKAPKSLHIGFVAAAGLFFMVWYPHYIGLPVSKEFADSVYFLLPSWK